MLLCKQCQHLLTCYLTAIKYESYCDKLLYFSFYFNQYLVSVDQKKSVAKMWTQSRTQSSVLQSACGRALQLTINTLLGKQVGIPVTETSRCLFLNARSRQGHACWLSEELLILRSEFKARTRKQPAGKNEGERIQKTA